MYFMLACLVLCLAYSQTVPISETVKEWDFEMSAREMVDSQWNEFKLTYKKQYSTETEELRRKKIFVENSIKYSKRNQLFAKNLVPTAFGMSKFSDLTTDEFLNTYSNCRKPSNSTYKASIFVPPAHVTLPDHVDWRKKGAVTPVKDQGNCGSCYSFGATGSLEGQHFVRQGQLVSLSEQQIIDCSETYGNRGCCGGDEGQAFEYIAAAGGIDTEETYPYEDRQYKCRYDPTNKGATDTGFKRIKEGDEEDLQKAVATVGPITVGISVTDSFKIFKPSGNTQVYYEPACENEDINHAVLVVGYGTDPDDLKHPDYWLVKNSWGNDFAENGYIKMARNADNNCHIASGAVYPLV